MFFLSEEKRRDFYGHQRTLKFNRFFINALDKFKAKTGFGDTYALFNIINEYLYQTGCMDEEGYQFNKKRYSLTLLEEAKRELRQIEDSEASEVKEAVESIPIRRKKTYVDYTKLSDDELVRRYQAAMLRNDVVEPQLIQSEANRRGFQLRYRDDGSVEKHG